MAVDPRDWRQLNQAWWDERVPLHVGSDAYAVEAFKAGLDKLRPFELELLGDVSGQRLVHLQCHFGLDTLSWARHGASVVGLDFSQPAVDAANGLADELGLDGRFVCSEVYDAVAALDGEQFDIVYTGFGALNWLPDLAAWADVVIALLKPGGRLLLAEFHPISWVFDDEPVAAPAVENDYFSADPFLWDDAGSYADPTAATVNNATVEFQHTLGTIFTVLLDRGLRILSFQEYDTTLFPRFPFLEERDGVFSFPDGTAKLPLMFTVLADAPG